jgi:hypothetical protein
VCATINEAGLLVWLPLDLAFDVECAQQNEYFFEGDWLQDDSGRNSLPSGLFRPRLRVFPELPVDAKASVALKDSSVSDDYFFD